MREIKFRAWDKKDKKMFYCNGSVFIEFNNDLVGGYVVKKYGEFSITAIGQYPDVIAMQYTGLKDSNGKEIYEGDIVKAKYKDDIPMNIKSDMHEIGEIIYSKDINGYGIKVLNLHVTISLNLFNELFVLGNKYQNLKLLKKES